MPTQLSWKCSESGEEVKVGDQVELTTPVYESILTLGKPYAVEGLGANCGYESVLLTNEAGNKDYYILEHFRKVLPKPENREQQTE